VHFLLAIKHSPTYFFLCLRILICLPQSFLDIDLVAEHQRQEYLEVRLILIGNKQGI